MKNRTKKSTVSCGALAWRHASQGDIEVLLIRQFSDSKKWSVPKGHMNSGETQEECAVREVLEETGVRVVLEDFVGSVDVDRPEELKNVRVWTAKIAGDHSQPSIDDPDCEIAEAAWHHVSRLPPISRYQEDIVVRGIEFVRSRLSSSGERRIFNEGFRNALDLVFSYAPHIDEWVTLKKEITKCLTSSDRRLLSRRDERTKEQKTNSFEISLIREWERMSGNRVRVESLDLRRAKSAQEREDGEES